MALLPLQSFLLNRNASIEIVCDNAKSHGTADCGRKGTKRSLSHGSSHTQCTSSSNEPPRRHSDPLHQLRTSKSRWDSEPSSPLRTKKSLGDATPMLKPRSAPFLVKPSRTCENIFKTPSPALSLRNVAMPKRRGSAENLLLTMKLPCAEEGTKMSTSDLLALALQNVDFSDDEDFDEGIASPAATPMIIS